MCPLCYLYEVFVFCLWPGLKLSPFGMIYYINLFVLTHFVYQQHCLPGMSLYNTQFLRSGKITFYVVLRFLKVITFKLDAD
jgi:hypothetical protein